MNKEIRVNERIRAREVRLVDEVGGQLGVVDIRDALAIARERGFDLIEIAPTATPPVCKLMDYGKYKYEQGRRDREAHKKQKNTEVKGIRLRPATDDHDLNVKLKHMLEFLKQGNKVKVTVIFRSREMSHPEFARRSLEKMAESAGEVGIVEKAPSFEGRTMTMIMAPKPVEKEKEKAPKPKPEVQEEPVEEPVETVAPVEEVAAEESSVEESEDNAASEPQKPKKVKTTEEFSPDLI